MAAAVAKGQESCNQERMKERRNDRRSGCFRLADVLVRSGGLGDRLLRFTHDLIPEFLVAAPATCSGISPTLIG